MLRALDSNHNFAVRELVGPAALTPLDFAGLLIMAAVTQLLHGPLFVHLLLQTAQSAFHRFTLAAFNIRRHSLFTPFGVS